MRLVVYVSDDVACIVNLIVLLSLIIMNLVRSLHNLEVNMPQWPSLEEATASVLKRRLNCFSLVAVYQLIVLLTMVCLMVKK